MKNFNALFLFLSLGFNAVAQNTETDLVKRAADHFESGAYTKALPMYSQLLSLNPESPEYNFRFGACAIYGGKDKGTAVKHLIYATKKGVTDARAWYFLGLAHHLNYEFKEAENAYREFGRKADTKLLNRYPMNKQLEMAKNGSALLKSIKDIVVLDKKQGGEEDFFRYFDLESTGGKILVAPEELLSKLDKKPGELNLIYFPKGATEIYFSSRGKDGITGRDIYKATVLPDGKFSTPSRLPAAINTGFDENFAFMHPDGQSFYFASQGHNSMGGYDIFRSQFDPITGSFSKPLNVDFAINTPDDDIFYITDAKNEVAFFASSRNAEQGVYNVYKVRVEGIPLQLVFLAGEYISQVDPGDRKAKITVTDELTGRKIDEQTTDATSGKYLLSLPKSGRFKLEVKPASSTLTHESIMQVPSYNVTVALRQELILTKDEGKERLTVNNFFDSPMDIDVAALSASLLRSKAALDVNAGSIEVPAAQPDLVYEKKRENAPLAAGFGEGTTIESVVANMNAQAGDIDAYARKVKEKSAKAYAIAAAKQQRTAGLNAEIKAIKDKANPGDANYVSEMTRAYKLIEESQITGREARSALELAKQTEKYSEMEKQRARDLRNNALAIQSTSDFDKTAALLTAEKDRQRKDQAQKNPGQAAADMGAMKEGEARKSTDRLLKLREEESSLKSEINRTEKKLEQTSKKKEQEELNAKLADLKQALSETSEAIQRQDRDAVKLSEDGEMHKLQSKMYDELITTTDNYGVSDNAVREMSSEEKSDLSEAVSNAMETTQGLRITDKNVLGLVTEEMKKPEYQGTASVSEQIIAGQSTIGSAQASGQSKPTDNARAEYNAAKQKISNINDPKADAYRQAFLAEQTLRKIDSDIEKLKSEKISNPSKAAELDAQIKEKEQWKSELEPVAKAPAANEMPSSDAKAAIGNLLSRDFATLSRAEVTTASLAQTTNDRLAVLADANAQKTKRGNDMLATSSPSEIQTAQREVNTLRAIENDILAVLNPSSSRAAFEAELKSTSNPEATAELRISQLKESKKAIVAAKSLTPEQRNALALSHDAEIAMAEKSAVAVKKEATSVKTETSQPTATAQLPADLPAAESDVLEVVYPGYAKRYEATAGKTDDQSLASLESTLREAQTRLNKEISTRKALLDQLKSTEQQEKVQVQIQQLTAVREKVEVELIPLERSLSNEEALRRFEADNDTTITFAPGTTEAEKEKLLEILQPAEPIDPDVVFDNERFEDMVASNEDPNLVLKNGEAMAATKTEIATLEMQIQSETSQSKIRKLDLKNEDLYGRLALQELANADEYAQMADYKSTANLAKIEELEGEKREMLLENNWLKGEIETLKEEAAAELEKADKQREQYKKTQDPIKKNFYYREALAWELSALERQQKAITILEEANLVVKQRKASESTFAQRTEERQEAVEAIAAGEEPKPLSKAVIADPVADASSNEPKTVTSSTVSESGSQPKSGQAGETTAQNTGTGNNTGTTQGTSNDAKYNDIKVNDRNQGVTFTINDDTYIRKAFKEGLGLSSDQTASAMNNPEVKAYLAQVEQAKANQTELANKESERAALVKDLEGIQAKIKQLEAAREKATTQAEKDALTVEINALSAQGEVVYNKIVALDKSMDKQYADQEKLLNQIKQSFDKIDLDQIADKTAATSAQTKPGNTQSTNSQKDDPTSALLNQPKSGQTNGQGNEPTIPSSTVASDAERMAAARARYGDNAKYFVFPKTLTEDIFTTNAQGVYSDKNPIPIDPELPDGVIFKVQVGAFRNSIPQNLFGGFAPVSGEKLNNGVTRYTAGLFIQFNNAESAKEQIRKMGYPDAFVVAYKNGKRIPIYVALGQSPNAPVTAAPKKENIVSAATASETKPAQPKPVTGSETPVNTTKAGTNPTDYYADFPEAAKADVINGSKDFFYTVQVGVYSKPVPVGQIYGIQPLNSEVLPDGKVRYSTGKFSSLTEASSRREAIKGQGVTDAFVTAYSGGKRITIEQAQALENGTSGQAEKVIPAEAASLTYDVFIGSFSGSVPDEVAGAMLDLADQAEVKATAQNGVKEYATQTFKTKAEAERIATLYRNMNVSGVKVRTYENGKLKE